MTLLPSRPCRWRGHTPQGVVKRLEDGLAAFLQDGWHYDTRMEHLELAGEVHEHDVCDGGVRGCFHHSVLPLSDLIRARA